MLFIKWLLCKTLLAQGKLAEAQSMIDNILKSRNEVAGVDDYISGWEKKYKVLEKMAPPRFEIM